MPEQTDNNDITDVEDSKVGWKEITISVVALVVTLALCFIVIYYWEYIEQLKQLGYAGVFLIGILTSATAVVPIPGLLIVFTLGSVLVPVLVGVFSGLGEAVGSIVIYLTGYAGHKAIKRIPNRFRDKFELWLKKRGSIAVLTMSVIINPVFMPFTAVAGMMRFGLVKFFLLCFTGKTIKNTIVAYLGYFGLGTLLRWIGVPI
jgi:membrane protein DedA with SNARE-associated domain